MRQRGENSNCSLPLSRLRLTNPVAVIGQHLNAPIPKLSGRRGDLARLDEVLSTALAKSPSARFESCGQFAAALKERLDAESISKHGPDVPPGPSWSSSPLGWKSQRMSVWIHAEHHKARGTDVMGTRQGKAGSRHNRRNAIDHHAISVCDVDV